MFGRKRLEDVAVEDRLRKARSWDDARDALKGLLEANRDAFHVLGAKVEGVRASLRSLEERLDGAEGRHCKRMLEGRVAVERERLDAYDAPFRALEENDKRVSDLLARAEAMQGAGGGVSEDDVARVNAALREVLASDDQIADAADALRQVRLDVDFSRP